MVSLDQLKREIAKQRAKITSAEDKENLRLEKIKLEKELKVLKRSPETKRNIELVSRTARGFKRLAGGAGKALIKQAKLIKEQQLREEGRLGKKPKKKKGKKKVQSSKGQKVFVQGLGIVTVPTMSKKKKSMKRKKRRKSKPKTKEPQNNGFFGF